MREKNRGLYLLLLTLVLGLALAFLIHSSEDQRWGHSVWEQWLIAHFHFKAVVAAALVFGVRKSMHFLGYGSLGLLFWLYFYLWRLKWPLFTGLLATAIVAMFDEYIQSTTTFRGGKPQDVLLDVAGAVTINLVRIFWIAKKRRESS